MPQPKPVLVPVDLLRLFFDPARPSPEVARLAVTWFVLVGGWEADFSAREVNLTNTRQASALWPITRFRAWGSFTTTSILLELQELGIVRIDRRVTDPLTGGPAYLVEVLQR